MTIPIPSLTKAPNGDYFARKAIPADVRDAYAAAYGVRREALFRLPAGSPQNEAKRAYAEWLLEVEERIKRLRAAASGSRPGEMTQLRRKDITKHRSGHWTLSITPEAGTVKGSVPRTIVLHATVELKTDFTQSVQDAVDQYRFDRHPSLKGQAAEPLLGFAGGALVHFAVSNAEVMMTTKLIGPLSTFLPFNQGNDGGKGNPPNPGGHPTAYLWEEVWQRDSWLEILGRYTVGVRDSKKQLTVYIFPRYHQLDATRKLRAAVLAEGAGASTSSSTRPGRARPTPSPGPPISSPTCTMRRTARASTACS